MEHLGWMVLGFVFLVGGAESLVRGASSLAIRLGVSPLVVGLTIVAFGTSSPELVVGVRSCLAGKGEIAVGTVLGSNICNILLILGVGGLMAPIPVHRQVLRFDLRFMVGVSIFLVVCLYTTGIPRWMGVVFWILLGIYIRKTLAWEKAAIARGEHVPDEEAPSAPSRISVSVILILAGMAGLAIGSEWLLKGCIGLARQLHVKEAIISLTLIALGSSLPELATAIAASLRKKNDILVGNVVGSNIFNILSILGASALTRPLSLQGIRDLDIAVMLGAAIACGLAVRRTGQLSRAAGGIFLGGYVLYVASLVIAPTGGGAH